MSPSGVKEWCHREVQELISIYKSYPCLWDTKSTAYRNRTTRSDTLLKVASIFNTSVSEITRKLHNLRSQFNGELKKLEKASQEGSEPYRCKWPYFKHLSFLCSSMDSKYEYAIKSTADADGSSSFNDDSEDIYYPQQHTAHKSHPQAEYNPQQSEYIEPLMQGGAAPETRPNHPRKRKIPERYAEEQQQLQLVPRKAAAPAAQEKAIDKFSSFGEYVANELRNLSSEYLQRKLRRIIQKAVLDIGEEEELLLSGNIATEAVVGPEEMSKKFQNNGFPC